jgi:hypothetical protein
LDLIKFGQLLSQLLPKIKTKIQLSGLVVGLAFALLVHFAKPGDNVALITAGSVGISLVIFGQLFNFLKDFKADDRPRVFLVAFGLFCLFTLSLLLVTVLLLRKPTLSVRKFDPTPEMEEASKSGAVLNEFPPPALPPANKNGDVNAMSTPDKKLNETKAKSVSLNSLRLPRPAFQSGDAKYDFREIDSVSTLKATLMYSVNSRHGLYPDADLYHEDLTWGSPWLSFDISNPSNENLIFTSLKTEAVEITLINEFIINVPEIDGATAQNTQLRIVNEGWGRARNPKLELRFARALSRDEYLVLGEKTFTVADIDEGVEINIGPDLPPVSQWQTPTHMSAKEAAKNRYLELLGRLSYVDEAGTSQTETFRATVFATGSGGGALFPSAAFNIVLPTEKDAYPLFTTLANCISPKSADELAVRLTTKRSARYNLKFTLTSTSGVRVENSAIVDILVPRFEHTSNYREGAFFKSSKNAGCS